MPAVSSSRATASASPSKSSGPASGAEAPYPGRSQATTRQDGQGGELRLPGRAAPPEAVQQHDHRPLPGLPPGDRAIHVAWCVRHGATLAAHRFVCQRC